RQTQNMVVNLRTNQHRTHKAQELLATWHGPNPLARHEAVRVSGRTRLVRVSARSARWRCDRARAWMNQTKRSLFPFSDRATQSINSQALRPRVRKILTCHRHQKTRTARKGELYCGRRAARQRPNRLRRLETRNYD